MGRNLKKILFILTIVFLAYGCSPKKDEPREESVQENVGKFTLRQFAEKTSFVLSGESAEISQSGKSPSVKSPSLSLKTSSEMIEITTGKTGKGQFDLLPETKKVSRIVFTGSVKIVYREISTGKTTMQGSCSKLTYIEADKMLVMEGSPVLERGSSRFSGDVIRYNFSDNTLNIEGSVNVQIPAE